MPKHSLTPMEIANALIPLLGAKPSVRKISKCRGGLFNASYRVNLRDGRSFIAQFSPPQDVPLLGHEKSFLRREKHFLTILRKKGFPVPQLLYQDFTKRRIDRDYIILEELEGHVWYYYQKRLLPGQNRRLYEELGSYAKRIHKLRNPTGQFGFPPPYRACATWSEFFLRYMHSLDEDNRRYELIDIDPELTPYFAARHMRKALDEIKVPHLLHGDLWPRNILIKREGRKFVISGIIDTERGMWGDPRFEWVFHGYPLGRTFWNTYGKPSLSGRNAQLRDLLYKSFCSYQASLECALHFKWQKDAQKLKKQTEEQVRELLKTIGQ